MTQAEIERIEEAAIQLKEDVDRLIKAGEPSAELYAFVGTLKVNLSVLKNRICTYLGDYR